MAFQISGITRDNTGNLVGSVEVYLLKYSSSTHLFTQVARTTSDASTGAFSFLSIADNDPAYNIVAFKDGTPHTFDISDRNITPITISSGVTWDAAHKDANVTLSNGSLTMLQNNATGGGGSRSTTSQSSGKFIFELKLDAATSGNHFNGIIGIAPAGQGVGGADIFGGSPTYVGLMIDGGVAYLNSTAGVQVTSGFFVVGQYIAVAVDMAVPAIWFKGTDAGNFPTGWNNAATGTQVDSGSGLGGIDFSGLTGPFYIWVDAFGTNNGGAGTLGVTLNTNIATFQNTDLPSSFGAWT